MRISDWSSDVCSSDLNRDAAVEHASVTACLTEIAALVRCSWEPGFYLDVQASPNLPRVQCSASNLQNAILNLVFNARAAMPAGGVISIAAAEVFRGTKLGRAPCRERACQYV